MSVARATTTLVDEFRSRTTLRAGSLITTIFGDAIAPRGGSVWIGSLIRCLEDFGASERLTRTSMFRLTKDGWFDVEQVGRRSYYRLTAEGSARFEQATHRIYGEPRQHWDGTWTLILLADVAAEQKDGVRKELTWLGFGTLTTNVLGHPAPDNVDEKFRQLIRLSEWALEAKDWEKAQSFSWQATRAAELGRDRRYALTILVEGPYPPGRSGDGGDGGGKGGKPN